MRAACQHLSGNPDEATYHRAMSERSFDWTARAIALIPWIEQGDVLDQQLEAAVLVQQMPRLFGLSIHPPREPLRWRAIGLTETRAEVPGRTASQSTNDRVGSDALPKHNRIGDRRHWLRLEAHAQIVLTCQRCMQALSLDLRIKRRFLVAANDADAEALENAAQDDFDVIAHHKRFDLLALIEDELLLSLPIVPKHSQCEIPGGIQEPTSAEPTRQRPFAVLAKLKRSEHEDPSS